MVLGALLPNYDPITQTISEIGRTGSPFEATFKVVNLSVAGFLILFAFGVYRFSVERHLSLLTAVLLGFFAAMELGVEIFESPNPWHNVFGLSSLLGFFAPLALAFTWPSTPDLRVLRRVSGVAALLVLIAVLLNLSPLFVQVTYIIDHYGLIQRTLFVFYLWCAYVAFILFRNAGADTLRNRPQAAQ